jgi:anti-sigma factor RsiW
MGLNRLEHIDDDLKRYLLGELRDDEQASVEQRVFAGDDTHEELLAVEEDLIDAYVGGELSAEDRARFESHFLSSERRVQKVATARALAAGIEATVREAPHQTKWSGRNWLIAAASLAIVAAGWLALRPDGDPRRNSRGGSPPPPVTSTPQQAVGPSPAPPSAEPSAPTTRATPSAAPSVIALTLVPGSSRDMSTGVRLVIPPTADFVQVDCRFEPADFRTYEAVLRTVGDRMVMTDTKLRARAVGKQMSVTLRWPAARLDANDYILTLSGLQSTGELEEIADYYFRVVRPAPGS